MVSILFILPSLTVGGLEKEQVTLANSLVNKGYKVTVMTLDPKDDLAYMLDKRVKFLYKPEKEHKIMRRIPYIRHKFYDDGMWEKRASAKKLYKYYVGNAEFDVEIAFFRGLSVKIISGSTNKNSKKIAWVHSDFRKAIGYTNNFKNLNCVKNAYKSFDKVVCVSEQAKEGFKSVIGDTGNLITIYNMLPTEEIKTLSTEKPKVNVKKDKFHIVLVGRLVDNAKGQVRLIKVVSRLKKEGYPISLALIGGGIDEIKIKDEIKRENAEEYITMTGSQSNPYPYIKQADLLVCASYYEGYNLTVGEAIILGVPVLSTDCAGPKEILNGGEFGVIVENSEEGIYKGIKELLNNPEKLSYYKEKTKERIDFFNEEKILKEVEGLFVN